VEFGQRTSLPFNPAQIGALAGQHGITLLPDLGRELAGRYNLRVMVKGGKMGSEYEAGLVEPLAAGILPGALADLPPPPSPPRTPLLPL
jgi:hypothetical protein